MEIQIKKPHDKVSLLPVGNGECEALMYKLFDRFIDETEKMGAVPIIVISPEKEDVYYKFKYGEHTSSVKYILEYCKIKKCLVFNSIDAIASEAKSAYDIKSLCSSHLTPNGNKLFAKKLFEYLKGKSLYSKPSKT